MGKNRALLQTLKKIPIFKDLSPTQVQKVLRLCQPRTCAIGEEVCARGTNRDEMYILIAGELGVKGEEDILLATLMPITTVGEMGMFSRHLRSEQLHRHIQPSVEALKESKVLVIERSPFEFMLRADQAMRVRI